MVFVRKWLTRIFVPLFLCCFIVGCFVVPVSASAGAGAASPTQGTTFQTFWNGYADVYLHDTDGNAIVIRMDLAQMLAYTPGLDGKKLYLYGAEIPHQQTATSDLGYDYWGIWDADSDDFYLGAEGYPFYELGYTIDSSTIDKVVFHFNPITFYYYSGFFDSIYVVGNGSYVTRVDCDYIVDSEKLPRHISKTYERVVTNGGYVSPLTATQIQDLFTTPNIPYSTTLLKIGLTITWTPSSDTDSFSFVTPVVSKTASQGFIYQVSRVGDSNQYLYLTDDQWESRINEVITYWWQNNDGGSGGDSGGGTIDDLDFTGWLAQSVGSVLDVPIFGSVTIGHICYTILAFAIVLWLLKLFAGG